jgi:hypothetical protein
MNERVVVGFMVGLVFSVGTWVWYSDFFTKAQKIIISISLLFPPGALAVILLISIYNKISESNIAAPRTAENRPIKDLKILEESLSKIKELHLKGIFSDSELNEKASELENQIQSIKEERVNQSFELKVKETEEYKALVVLRSSQVIDGEEFDKKVKKLVEQYSSEVSSPHLNDRTKVEANSSEDSMTSLVYVSLVSLFFLVIIVAYAMQ